MQSLTVSPLRLLALATCATTLALLIVACKSSSPSSDMTAAAPASITCAAAGSNAKNPTAPTSIDATCAQLPFTPATQAGGDGGKKQITNQQAADMYSWLSFVAVNWPANTATCTPDTTKTILTNPSSPTWLTWTSPTQIFKASGAPDPWCGGTAAPTAGALSATQQNQIARLPLAVRKIATAHPEITLYLSHSSKSEDLTSAVPILLKGSSTPDPLKEVLQSTDRPIIDQNGRFARYSVVVGHDEYNFIANNALYTKSGQTKNGPATFPSSDPTTGNQGGLELKAAWKVMGPGDNPANFYTQQAIVYNDQSGEPSPIDHGIVTVGLISLHIIHKAANQAVWTWATFEQESNTTTSFFNPHCVPPTKLLGDDCIPNQPTAGPNAQELSPTGKPLQFPTQITVKPYSTVTGDDYNAAFQTLLAGTAWAHYKLVSTQWLRGATGLVPQFMASTVQETFVPKLTSSGQTLDGCGSCHRFANDAVNQPADFSFLLSHAQQK